MAVQGSLNPEYEINGMLNVAKLRSLTPEKAALMPHLSFQRFRLQVVNGVLLPVLDKTKFNYTALVHLVKFELAARQDAAAAKRLDIKRAQTFVFPVDEVIITPQMLRAIDEHDDGFAVTTAASKQSRRKHKRGARGKKKIPTEAGPALKTTKTKTGADPQLEVKEPGPTVHTTTSSQTYTAALLKKVTDITGLTATPKPEIATTTVQPEGGCPRTPDEESESDGGTSSESDVPTCEADDPSGTHPQMSTTDYFKRVFKWTPREAKLEDGDEVPCDVDAILAQEEDDIMAESMQQRLGINFMPAIKKLGGALACSALLYMAYRGLRSQKGQISIEDELKDYNPDEEEVEVVTPETARKKKERTRAKKEKWASKYQDPDDDYEPRSYKGQLGDSGDAFLGRGVQLRWEQDPVVSALGVLEDEPQTFTESFRRQLLTITKAIVNFTTPRGTAHAIQVDGCHTLAPRHAIMDGTGYFQGAEPFMFSGGAEAWSTIASDYTVLTPPTCTTSNGTIHYQDWVLLRHKKARAGFPNISKMFATIDQMRSAGTSTAYWLLNPHWESGSLGCESPKFVTEGMSWEVSGLPIFARDYMQYQSMWEGACGLPTVRCKDGKFLISSIHVGSRTAEHPATGVGLFVPRSLLQSMMSSIPKVDIRPETGFVDSLHCPFKLEATEPNPHLDQSYEQLGSIPSYKGGGGRTTRYAKSALFDHPICADVNKEPALLGDPADKRCYDEDGHISGVKLMIMEHNRGVKKMVYDPILLEEAITGVAEHMRQSSFPFPDGSLNLDEVLNGSERYPNVVQISMNTSACFPLSRDRPGKGKHNYIARGDDGRLALKPTQLIDMLAADDLLLQAGITPTWVSESALKDELRNPTKIKAMRTRVVVAAPLAQNIALKRLWGSFVHYHISTLQSENQKMGISVYSDDYNQLVSRFRKFGDASTLVADWHKFECMFVRSLFEGVYRCMEATFRDKSDQVSRRASFEALIDTRVLVGSYLIIQKGHNPSGHYLTTPVGDVGNNILHGYAFLDIARERGLNLGIADYFRMVALNTYSDDVKASTWAPWYTPLAIGRVFNDKVRITGSPLYTAVDKESSLEDHHEMEASSPFIGVITREVQPGEPYPHMTRYVSVPHDYDYASVAYVAKTLDPVDALVTNVDCLLMRLSGLVRPEFEEIRESFISALEDVGISFIPVTHDRCITMYKLRQLNAATLDESASEIARRNRPLLVREARAMPKFTPKTLDHSHKLASMLTKVHIQPQMMQTQDVVDDADVKEEAVIIAPDLVVPAPVEEDYMRVTCINQIMKRTVPVLELFLPEGNYVVGVNPSGFLHGGTDPGFSGGSLPSFFARAYAAWHGQWEVKSIGEMYTRATYYPTRYNVNTAEQAFLQSDVPAGGSFGFQDHSHSLVIESATLNWLCLTSRSTLFAGSHARPRIMT